jgi:hypothetical protein
MKKNSLKLQLAVLSILVSVILNCSCSNESFNFPDQISGLHVIEKIAGKEAVAYIDNLHQKPIAPAVNEIVKYQFENAEALIYLSYYETPKAAISDKDNMISKLNSTRTPFIMGETIEINERKVYRCFGLGQTHYILQAGSNLFWVSVTTIKANQFMTEFINFLENR